MKLKSALRKAGMALGGLLLACNIGCSSRFTEAGILASEEGLEQHVEEPKAAKPAEARVKAWQYPVNLLGGAFVSGSAHEASHALAVLSMGKRIDDFCLPFVPNEYGQIMGYTISADLHDENPDSSDSQQSFMRIAGTLGEVALIESINYNLRNGNIPRNYQPFWATTSLVTRVLMLNNVVQGLNSPRVAHSANDFVGLEYNSGITVEQSAAAIGLYALLSAGRIKGELNAAIGRRYYPESKKKSARTDVVPSANGIAMQCRVDF